VLGRIIFAEKDNVMENRPNRHVPVSPHSQAGLRSRIMTSAALKPCARLLGKSVGKTSWPTGWSMSIYT